VGELPGLPRDSGGAGAADESQASRKHAGNFSIEQDNINTVLSPQLKRLFNQFITINSAAFEDINPRPNSLLL